MSQPLNPDKPLKKITSKKTKKIIYLLLLLGIFIFHLTINYQIIKKSQFLRWADEPFYISCGFTCYKAIFSNPQIGISQRMNKMFIATDARQRNFLYLVEALSWKIGDIIKAKGEDSMIFITNSIFLLILLMSIYGIGSSLYGRNIGLLSALLTSMFPLVFGHSRVAMTDYPLMCMVSLSFYLLLRTDGFRSLLYSILTGIALGVSQFTKETSIIFIFSPLLYYFIKAYSSGEKKKIVANFAITISFFLIIAGAVFFKTTDLHAFKNFWLQTTVVHNNGYLFYYSKTFFINAVGPFMFILSLPLLISYLINIKKMNKLLFLWLFIPFTLFSFSTNQMHRFLMPLLPALALIVSQELFAGGLFKALKTALKVIFIPCLMMQYIFINTGLMSNQFYEKQFDYGILSTKKNKYFLVSTTLLDVFKKEAIRCENTKKVLFLFHLVDIVAPLSYKFGLYGLPFNWVCPMGADIASSPAPGTVNWQKEVLTADYIVDNLGIIPGDSKGLLEDISSQLKEGFEKYKDKFKKIDEIKADNLDVDICVYKRIKT